MTDDQITALAREYAEWVTNVPKAKELPNCLLNEANTLIADDAERMLTWLSRRYALVEKSTIKETWEEITNVYLAHQHITYDGARYLFNEVLFPEIGKEA